MGSGLWIFTGLGVYTGYIWTPRLRIHTRLNVWRASGRLETLVRHSL